MIVFCLSSVRGSVVVSSISEPVERRYGLFTIKQLNSTVIKTLKVQLKVDRRSPTANRTPVSRETDGDTSDNRFIYLVSS